MPVGNVIKVAKVNPKRLIPIMALGVVLAIVLIVIWFNAAISAIHMAPSGPAVSVGAPSVSLKIAQQNLLFYNASRQGLPYVLLNYATKNTSNMLINVAYLQSPPSTTVYVLNWTNQCISCSNALDVVAAINSSLTEYTILNRTNRLQIVSKGGLSGIKNDSVLVVLNGLLPDYMLLNTSLNPDGVPEVQYLLSKGTTIIYVGLNFTNLVGVQAVIEPSPKQLPPYLSSSSYPFSIANRSFGYYFNNPTFTLGGIYGPITYNRFGKGYIVAFSNLLSSWKTPQQTGADISKAIETAFWIQRIAIGSATVAPSNITNSTGKIGIVLSTRQLWGPGVLQLFNSSYAEVVTAVENSSSANFSNARFNILKYRPSLNVNGSVLMPAAVLPGQPFTALMTVFIKSPNTHLEPHFDIMDTNMTTIATLPPIFSTFESGNYTFLKSFSLPVPPGQYIAYLRGNHDQPYAAALVNVPNINIGFDGINTANNSFKFTLTSLGRQLPNVTATISLNNNYTQILKSDQNGTLVYALPANKTIPAAMLNFSFTMFGGSQLFQYNNKGISITINKQYYYFAVALIIVLLEVTLIRAPVRDEFYIDIPSLPEPQKIPIKLKPDELVGVFDKLNLYYHWRFMPLSKEEFRLAISSNIRSGSMPISLTFNNVDLMLTELAGHGFIVGIDGLYAPSQWMAQSKHDMIYLATFKKMRVYLVSHAHIFTDLDKSESADIVTTLHNEKAYIVIYSKTSKFQKIPVYKNAKTYLVFLNSDMLEEFTRNLYQTTSPETEELKSYISIGSVKLIDADNPEGLLT